MNNEQMIERFFAGEVGQKLQKESTDESLALRRMLLNDIKILKDQIADPAANKKVAALQQAKTKAFNDLKAAELAWQQSVIEQNDFITKTSRKIKALEADLVAASPSFIATSLKKLLDRLSTTSALNSNQSATVRKLLDRVESWKLKSKVYDEMNTEFKEIQEEFEDALIRPGPIEIGRIVY